MKRIVFLLALVVVATAGFAAEPVPNLPDYNGTYWGTPNTGGDCDADAANCDSLAGRKMFTTLYRDNYERESGCAGEGCGKHPGVDIDVVSGTPVRAALSGTVVRKESCNSSWGGLVVIESTNPYASGNVYHSYAHLRSVSVSNGDWVDQDEVIGNSGGASSDPCHGASTGSHLHFQVDKPHGGTYPWFPTGRVEDADSDFEVLEYTHNPLPFVQGYAYNFTFAEDGNKEFWGAVNVPNYFVSGSYLRVDSSSTAPYVGRGSYFGTVSSCGEGAPWPVGGDVRHRGQSQGPRILRTRRRDRSCDREPRHVGPRAGARGRPPARDVHREGTRQRGGRAARRLDPPGVPRAL